MRAQWSEFGRVAAGLRSLAAITMMLIAAVAGCGGKPAASSSTADRVPPTSSSAAQSPAKDIVPDYPVVRLETNLGAITIRLDAVHAPGTVRNFLNYVSEGFYNNSLIHYVDAGKMILAGGYTADRQPKPPRTAIRNEAHNGLKNVRGTVAMTRDQSLIDSATSQFFINLADSPQRDHQGDAADQYGYCVFGEVIEGLDVAERISQSATTNLGGDLIQTPQPPVIISSVRVVK